MKLRINDLEEIVKQLKALEATELDVEQLNVGGHKLFLRRQTAEQRTSGSVITTVPATPHYEVLGISDRPMRAKGDDLPY